MDGWLDGWRSGGGCLFVDGGWLIGGWWCWMLGLFWFFFDLI